MHVHIHMPRRTVDLTSTQKLKELDKEKSKIVAMIQKYRGDNGGKPMPRSHPLALALIQIDEERLKELVKPR